MQRLRYIFRHSMYSRMCWSSFIYFTLCVMHLAVTPCRCGEFMCFCYAYNKINTLHIIGFAAHTYYVCNRDGRRPEPKPKSGAGFGWFNLKPGALQTCPPPDHFGWNFWLSPAWWSGPALPGGIRGLLPVCTCQLEVTQGRRQRAHVTSSWHMHTVVGSWCHLEVVVRAD